MKWQSKKWKIGLARWKLKIWNWGRDQRSNGYCTSTKVLKYIDQFSDRFLVPFAFHPLYLIWLIFLIFLYLEASLRPWTLPYFPCAPDNGWPLTRKWWNCRWISIRRESILRDLGEITREVSFSHPVHSWRKIMTHFRQQSIKLRKPSFAIHQSSNRNRRALSD